MYKTKLCSMFLNDGKCHEGINCKFAHGVQDLRMLTRRELTGSMLGSHDEFGMMRSSSMRANTTVCTSHPFQSVPPDFLALNPSKGKMAGGNGSVALNAVDEIHSQTREIVRPSAKSNKIPREYKGCTTAGFPEGRVAEVIESFSAGFRPGASHGDPDV